MSQKDVFGLGAASRMSFLLLWPKVEKCEISESDYIEESTMDSDSN